MVDASIFYERKSLLEEQKHLCTENDYSAKSSKEQRGSGLKLYWMSDDEPVTTGVPSISSAEAEVDSSPNNISLPGSEAEAHTSRSSAFLNGLSGEKTRRKQRRERNRPRRTHGKCFLDEDTEREREEETSQPSTGCSALRLPMFSTSTPVSTDDRIRILEDSVAETVIQKNALIPPLHSNFRVFCTVLYRMDGKIEKESGSNWETCYMGGTICAERVALTALRVKVVDLSKIEIIGLIIASDAEEFITPGPMCREFLSEYPTVTAHTPIILVNAEQCTSVTTLSDLWPHPCHYKCGVNTVETDQELEKIPEDREEFYDLYQQVHLAAIKAESPWYPISYAAGARLKNGEVKITTSTQALEYGCSLDAMLKLYAFLEDYRSRNIEATFLLFCDQHGRLHAPFAPARALLSENGYHIPMVLHQGSSLAYTSTPKLYDCDSLDLKSMLSSPTSSPMKRDATP